MSIAEEPISVRHSDVLLLTVDPGTKEHPKFLVIINSNTGSVNYCPLNDLPHIEAFFEQSGLKISKSPAPLEGQPNKELFFKLKNDRGVKLIIDQVGMVTMEEHFIKGHPGSNSNDPFHTHTMRDRFTGKITMLSGIEDGKPYSVIIDPQTDRKTRNGPVPVRPERIRLPWAIAQSTIA